MTPQPRPLSGGGSPGESDRFLSDLRQHLDGPAASVPLRPEDKYSITYYAPQPRAVLRVVNPKKTEELVGYGEWGRVELNDFDEAMFHAAVLEADERCGVRRDRVCSTRPHSP